MRTVEANGVSMSVIGVGTWQFGSREWGYGSHYADVEVGRILERAFELGINVIDTAELYSRGRSERIVGRELARLSARDRAFVATKLLPLLPLGEIVLRRGRASRRRLGIDVIDLYQLHFFNRYVPIERQVAGLRALQREGIVREIGVSMFDLAQWQDAEAALDGPILTNQVMFSLAAPDPSTDVVPWAAANDRVVIAASPLAMGLLSCRYDATEQPIDLRRRSPLFRPENLAAAQPLFEAIRTVAAGYDATPAQIALAWVIHHPNVVAIPGASSVAQLEQNAEAAEIDLTDGEMARLSEAAADFHPVSPPYTKWNHLAAIGRELVA
jgi:aryl-alcohol dehydrogenase-like predicted oxidoreductase